MKNREELRNVHKVNLAERVKRMVLSDMDRKSLLLTAEDKDDETYLHTAALCGQLDSEPKELLTAENILAKDDWGRNVIYFAAVGRCLNQVPSALLTEENMLVVDKEGRTVVHCAAVQGCLTQVPEKVLVAALLLKDCVSGTPIHDAAKYGYLGRIPKELLTLENMTVRNKYGETAIHLAACYGDVRASRGLPTDIGFLEQVPKELITVETMLMEDGCGKRPIDIALANGQIDMLLGLEFPEVVREVVGEDWWEKNQQVLQVLGGLTNTDVEGSEVDLF